MGENTEIGWTHRPRVDGSLMPGHTHNIVWGCQKVSEECEDCYAEVFAKRVGLKIWGPPKTTTRRVMSDKYWARPLRWNAAAAAAGEQHLVFCSSMADVLEDHPVNATQRPRLWPLVEATPNLIWLILTKRPENAPRMLPDSWWEFGCPPNVWFGTTAGLQRRLDERWPHLLLIPARRRFLSVEPCLEQEGFTFPGGQSIADPEDVETVSITSRGITRAAPVLTQVEPRPDWVIIGGKTAPDYKRVDMNLGVAEAAAAQLVAAGVPVYVKQDSGRYPGQRGRLSDWMWSLKQFPRAVAA